MNTLQINKILHRNDITKDYYIGCFASNSIPVSINFTPFCMVVNLDPSSGAGSHWIGIFCENLTNIDYYDSLGIWPPISPYIRDYLCNFERVRFNTIQVQNSLKPTCGKHVIFFLFQRCKGFSMNKIIQFLKTVKADDFVSEFIKNKIFNINS